MNDVSVEEPRYEGCRLALVDVVLILAALAIVVTAVLVLRSPIVGDSLARAAAAV